jgi:hypothetical protein
MGKGILFIQDLLNERGQIMTKQDLELKLDRQIAPLRYESLISAIPKEWKKLLNDNRNLNMNYLVFRDTNIIIDNRTRQITDINTRELYWHILKACTKRPTSEIKWQEKTDLNLNNEEWATIYTLNNEVTRDNNILNLQFKITHRLLACGYNLKVWKIRTCNLCEICKEHVDTIEHFMIQCDNVHTFWKEILNWWTESMKVIFRLDTYEILFGIPNDEKDPTINQFNFILMMARFYIYRCKKAGFETEMNIHEFLLECKKHLRLEEIIMAEKNLTEKFKKTWEELYISI